MAAPMAKIKQVFKVEKLNQQKKETIKSHNTYSNYTINTLTGTI